MNYDPQTVSNVKMAEESLLSCFLMSPDTFNVVGDWFTQSDFYDSNNGEIFKAIKHLSDSGEVVDLISVAQQVKTLELKTHSAQILTQAGSSSSYEYYAKLVKEYATKRKLDEIGKVLSYQATGETKSEDLIKDLEQKLADLTATQKGGGEINTKEQVDEILENIKRLKDNPQDVTGITTGFGKLDMKLSGLHTSDLIILAARPARGKSAFALQLARNVAYAHHPVLFFSLEMGAEQLIQRLVASESKVDLGKIRSGRVTDIEVQALELGGDIIKTLPLYFNDKAGVQVKDIRSQLKLHNSRQEKIEFVIVDYLQLMAIGKNSNNMVQDVTEISRGLKMIAKEFNVPVLALSQLSRKVEERGGKPKLSDLRDSGSIEQDADIVMFLHADNPDEDSFGNKDIELLIEKHRNGSTGSLPLKFQGSKMTFCEVDESLDPANW